MIYRPLILSLIFAMTGCASVSYDALPSEIKQIDYPALNSVNTVTVGEVMVDKGIEATTKFVRITSAISVTADTIPAGDYQIVGGDEKYLYFQVVRDYYTNNVIRIGRESGDEICLIYSIGTKGCGNSNAFEVYEEAIEAPDSFRQTLIYNGRAGNSAKIIYREFQGGYARPAFDNDAVYDLSESMSIAYKGVRLDVIKADNVSITYMMLSNF